MDLLTSKWTKQIYLFMVLQNLYISQMFAASSEDLLSNSEIHKEPKKFNQPIFEDSRLGTEYIISKDGYSSLTNTDNFPTIDSRDSSTLDIPPTVPSLNESFCHHSRLLDIKNLKKALQLITSTLKSPSFNNSTKILELFFPLEFIEAHKQYIGSNNTELEQLLSGSINSSELADNLNEKEILQFLCKIYRKLIYLYAKKTKSALTNLKSMVSMKKSKPKEKEIERVQITSTTATENTELVEIPEILKYGAMCYETTLVVEIEFSRVYRGILYAASFYNNATCNYMRLSTGEKQYAFNLNYNTCGSIYADPYDANDLYYLETIIAIVPRTVWVDLNTHLRDEKAVHMSVRCNVEECHSRERRAINSNHNNKHDLTSKEIKDLKKPTAIHSNNREGVHNNKHDLTSKEIKDLKKSTAIYSNNREGVHNNKHDLTSKEIKDLKKSTAIYSNNREGVIIWIEEFFSYFISFYRFIMTIW